jgi:hypothetical protein
MTETVYDNLSEFHPVRYLAFRDSEHHGAIFSIKTGTEEFTHELANLLRGKIHHSDNLLGDEFFFAIVDSYLCAGFFDSDFSSKIHSKTIGWFPCLRKILDGDDGSHSELD